MRGKTTVPKEQTGAGNRETQDQRTVIDGPELEVVISKLGRVTAEGDREGPRARLQAPIMVPVVTALALLLRSRSRSSVGS